MPLLKGDSSSFVKYQYLKLGIEKVLDFEQSLQFTSVNVDCHVETVFQFTSRNIFLIWPLKHCSKFV